MSFRRFFQGAAFTIILLLAGSAWAVNSSLWEVDSKDSFDAGEVEGVSIMPPGKVTLGPLASVSNIYALYAWTLAEDSKGAVYIGTGGEGKIFKFTGKGEPEVFADLELQQIFGLAMGKKDMLYAAGFPGGKIYSINRRGEVEEVFDTGQNTVWALCLGPDGEIFAATGDEGQIYKIESSGKGALLYDSSERRILSLLCDEKGRLYAGSEQHGLIYRIDQDGKPFVLYDTELEEVTAMTMDEEGNLYAVSSPGDLFMKAPPKVVPAAPQAGGQGGAQQAHAPRPPLGMPVIPSQKKRTCIIYKIAEDGAASKFWTSPEQLTFSLAFDGPNLLAGTGDEGIIYMIFPSGESGVYYKVDQKQVLALHRAHDGSIVASFGNDAGIATLGADYASEGNYISQVHDATAVSQWGRVFWEADLPARAKISFATRSGNSENPDDTWSEWSKEHVDKEGFTADSPIARYIQWRASLSALRKNDTPTLHKVTLAYIQRNFAPVIESVDIDGNGEKKGNAAAEAAKKLKAAAAAMGIKSPNGPKAANASKEGVKTAPEKHETKIKIKWKANDENRDELEYELYFKGVKESRWKLLEEKLTEPKYSWDTEAVPDGEYHIKVVASDSPANPKSSSLKAERVSESFTVDNTAPVVSSFRAEQAENPGTYRVFCVVTDNRSPVRLAHLSVDAGDWALILPADGIFDSLSENVEFTTDTLEKGEHTIVIKAVDYFGNIGAGKVTFLVK